MRKIGPLNRVILTTAAIAVAGSLTASALAQEQGTQQQAPRQMEYLKRGVVAMPTEDGKVYVGWRLLGTEPENIAFNVYRQSGDGEPTKVNEEPITDSTNLVDEGVDLSKDVSYTVKPVIDGQEQEASDPYTLKAGQEAKGYLSIPIKTPEGYSPNDASTADLDGDGEYELVLKQDGRARDNSQGGPTDPVILQAYELDGTQLWEINLGPNIRAGAHYTQFLVYDFDGDGRAEVVAKTSDGTVDGEGNVLGDADAKHANEGGHVLKGPEWLTVFDGRTGAELDTVDYKPARTENNPENPDLEEYDRLWGDDYGNRGERYLAGVAYLDGVHPSIVMARGYYTRSTLGAYDFRDGKLQERWLFDTGPDRNNPYFGQGNHQLSVADIDNDGKDEIIYGAAAIDDDGTGLWSTELGHGDAMHVGDLIPDRPGLEMFRIQERFGDAGAHMVDLKTGEVIWRKPSVAAAESGGDRGEGPGRGVAFDVDPRHLGAESWTAGAGIEGVWNAKGEEIYDTKLGSVNFAAWWDGDLLRELLDRNHISEWDYENLETKRLLTAEGATSINGTKANPSLSADLLGDWREEVIWPSEDGSELRLYTTTIPTEHRIYTLMHDPVYRLGIAWQNVAYNQPPHTGFYIGPEMKDPPKPNIEMVRAQGQERSASAGNGR